MAARVALVTGSSSGIGLGIARVLSQKCDVIMTGLADNKTKKDILSEFQKSSKRASHFIDSNIASDEGVTNLCNEVMKLYPKGVDILVNNAGIQHVSPVEDFPVAKWHEMMAIHLTSSFLLIRQFMPYMKERGWGRVVNMASVNGLISMPGKVPYCTAKWGMIGMIKAAALETAELGVTCNAVCPAYVETELVNQQVRAMAKERGVPYEEAWEEYYRNAQPTKKPIKVEENMDTRGLRCSYCKRTVETHEQAAHHCMTSHPTEHVSFIVETGQGKALKYLFDSKTKC